MTEKNSLTLLHRWYAFAVFNLVILALLGLTLRYKINFPLPWLQQEHLLHAHSHFAFNGWVSFLLQLLILEEFTNDYNKRTRFWDRFFLVTNLVNYTMTISFALFGYNMLSIVLSTLALWLSYLFVFKIYRSLDQSRRKTTSNRFVVASLFFLLLSSLGPYAIAVLMATKSTSAYGLHNALYFFLHFQYNGWFAFAVLAFLFKKLEASPSYNKMSGNIFFLILFITCIPSYLFTTLWHHRPGGVTGVIFITAALQTLALFFLWRLLRENMQTVFAKVPVICRRLYFLAISAFILKVLLQFFSLHPQVALIAFGFRPVIIGYLHLIFLVFVSIYLISFLTDKNIISPAYRLTTSGIVVFTAGAILNEILLAIQGFAAIYYLFLPGLNLLLFANTFILVAGALLLFFAVRRTISFQRVDK